MRVDIPHQCCGESVFSHCPRFGPVAAADDGLRNVGEDGDHAAIFIEVESTRVSVEHGSIVMLDDANSKNRWTWKSRLAVQNFDLMLRVMLLSYHG